ncbi:hypothetical protein AAC387_Pa08g1103 [Persea americana]
MKTDEQMWTGRWDWKLMAAGIGKTYGRWNWKLMAAGIVTNRLEVGHLAAAAAAWIQEGRRAGGSCAGRWPVLAGWLWQQASCCWAGFQGKGDAGRWDQVGEKWPLGTGKNGRWTWGNWDSWQHQVLPIQDGKEERDKWKKGLAAGLLAGRVCECDQLAAEPGDS